jgi:PBP1b-binding outer membrane lipoprotein LpoB
MKKQLLMVGMMLVLITIGFSGCTQQNSSSDESDQTTPPTTESIHTILTKAETIESMYYEITASINMSSLGPQTTTIKIWQKTPYLKEEITSVIAGTTNTVSVIQRPEGTYTYDTIQGKYVITTNTTSLQQPNSEIIKDLLNNQNLTNLGTETIDGKEATIIQYAPLQGGSVMTIKMWLWNEKGVPLQALFTLTMEGSTIIMDYKYNNYSFVDIPDSTFSVL